MKINKKLAPIPLFVSLALTGCIEVDDDSNDGVVDALNQQNAVLEEQNNLLAEQLENNETAVTLSGLVVSADSEMPVDNLLLTVYKGASILVENLEAEEGRFEIENLPASSDLTIVASTSDDSYVSRAFFITTRSVNSGEAFDDIGTLKISKPVNVRFSITNVDTGLNVAGLSFTGFSYLGNATSNVGEFAHQSTYLTETEEYEITLPRDFNVTLQANIDFDDDGVADYLSTPSDSIGIAGENLFIYRASSFQQSELQLRDNVPVLPEQKSLAITLIDSAGNVLSDATFTADIDDEAFDSSFNAESQLHELTVPFDNYVDLEMPSFSIGDTTYSSGNITLRRETVDGTDQTRIRVSGYGFSSNTSFYINDETSLNLVLVAREVEPFSSLEVITKTLDRDSYEYSVFYNEAVSIADEEVSLTFQDITVTRGNDSDSDGVPLGYTYVERVTQEVAIISSPSLGGIKQTFSPAETLRGNTSYEFNIGQVMPLAGGASTTVYNDDLSFTTGPSEENAFSINDVTIDNTNYYSNGAIIISENSAGEPNTANNNDGSVRFMFPVSVESLNFLNITTQSYTEGEDSFDYVRRLEIVRNGNVRVSRRFALAVAANESVDTDSYVSLLRGSAIEDSTYIYTENAYLTLGDNTAEMPSSVTFFYEYQTKDGVNDSGTLTLPVQ